MGAMLARRNLMLPALLGGAFALAIAAQGESIVTIPSRQCLWHAGDNPAWAAPGLDESGWKPLSSWNVSADQPWMWVRCHADLSGLRQAAHPALQVDESAAYQIFLNGNLVGQNGNLRSGHFSLNAVRTFPVPAGNVAGRADTVALRLLFRTEEGEIGNENIPQIAAGDAPWLRDWRDSEALAGAVSFLPVAIGFGVIGVMGFVLLGLYLNDRSHLELLLLALVCWCLSILRLSDFCVTAMAPISDQVYWAAYAVGQLLILPSVWFMFRLAHRRVPMLYKILLAFGLIFAISCASSAFFPAGASLRVDAFYGKWLRVFLADGAILMAAPFVAFWPWNRISRGMRAVAGCAMLWGLMDCLWFCTLLWLSLGPASNTFYTRWQSTVLELRAFGTMAAIIALIGLLFREQRRTAAERALLAGEMQAAREIQRMLAPAQVETATGAGVEVAFRPMREVGGDFYLCRVLPDGRQRVLVGDVSGKGAAAAMTATLLIGAAERRDENSPTALLGHLNLVLHGSQVGGFATCLCADLAPDGTVTLANAGHPAPYWRGEEVAVAPSLPLGVSASEAAYEEQRLHLAEGETLTFVSDGVVEARDSEGRLFGFERTRAISSESVDRIAEAAQAYGQKDDITVVKLMRKAGKTAAVAMTGAVPEAT
jgi:phosphoserine phosphatase RsbU/P